MGDIFQNAYEVICWLGRADRYLDDAVELHHRLAMVEERFGAIKEAVMSPEEIDHACQTSGIGTKGHKATASLCKSCMSLWRRRWFYRLWVAQEVGLAKQLTVLCGEYRIDWQEIVLIAEHARAAWHNPAWNFYFYSLHPFSFAACCCNIIRCLQEQGIRVCRTLQGAKLGGRNEARNAYLLEVLQLTTHLQATDPRDKIFGVLGLVSRAPTDKNSAIRPIHVNYDLSVREIFVRFSTALIIDLPYLYLITWETFTPGACDYELPSWVPDFSVTGHWGHYNKYKAGIVFGQRSPREVNNRTLKVWGHLLGTISSLHSTKFNASFMTQLQFLLTTKRIAKWQPNIIESLCRATIMGCDESKRVTTRYKDKLKIWLLVELSNLAAQNKHCCL